MAEESKKPNVNKDMMKIPVFSVLKNGTILKNIILNNPQWLVSNEEDRGFSGREDSPILIGRHPDCHIVLDHPSISRFHLEIRAKPASLSLSVTDRSSVHGTWVCGNKIQPYIPIDLAEGDTVRLGASTRVYSLHWVPLSSAIEMENPLPAVLEEENEETQKEKPTEELPLVPPALEGENQSPLVSESAGSLLPTEEVSRTPEKNANADEIQSERRVTPSSLLSRRSKSKSIGFLCVETGRKEQKYGETREEAVGNTEPGKREEETYCRTLPAELDDEEEEEETFVSDKENMTPFSSTAQKLKRNCIEMQGTFNSSKDSSLEDELDYATKERVVTNARDEENLIQDFSSCNAFHSDKENWTPEVPKELKSNETFVSDKDNMTPGGVSGVRRSEKLSSESHAGREQLTERGKERVPFQSLLENSNSPVSYRERLLLPLQSPIEKSPLGNNTIPDNYADEGNMNSSLSHYLTELHNSSGECMETLLRNSIPVDYEQRLVDEGNADFSFSHTQTADDKLQNPSKWNMVVDVDCLLNEESRKSLQLMEGLKGTHLIIPRIVIRELDCLKRRESLLLLLFRRETKKAAAASSALRWIEECMAKFGWWIHVQTTSEALPVPPTPPATPRSQLGGDGSSEELGAGTASGSSSSVAFSSCGSLTEIVSPTAEDHILDCALLFTTTKGDEQLVVLSDSTTLKIKAMAEGLMCETLKEFHTSLVNPCSTRFLWSASSPRGPTWSCVDEAVLIENYYQQFPALRRTEKPTDVVKGLKLILLHNNNSRYGKTNLVEES